MSTRQLSTALLNDNRENWVGDISNDDLKRLIYLILSWKEGSSPPATFDAVLDRELASLDSNEPRFMRLTLLKQSFLEFRDRKLFHPFMSDIIGNTICADLLDYIPRDRKYLGMEVRLHERLQRFFTIRNGTKYDNEGFRMSIMVTRKGRGGQRRDVATSVLDAMRDRYEMAQGVYYHHKKASASTMLAKLVELADEVGKKPLDDESIYPAPWTDTRKPTGHGASETMSRPEVPHLAHMGDLDLINYLGTKVEVKSERVNLRDRLYDGLRYHRKQLYRTLLVIDTDLVHASSHGVSYFTDLWRGPKERPSRENREELEKELAHAVGGEFGDVLIYCPSPEMQAKEVDARLEIVENKILPLRDQTDAFAYKADIDVLTSYYHSLWRAYIFVTPELFIDRDRCKKLIQHLCERYSIDFREARRKSRKDIAEASNVTIDQAPLLQDISYPITEFLGELPFLRIPPTVAADYVKRASQDPKVRKALLGNASCADQLSALFAASALTISGLETARGILGRPPTDMEKRKINQRVRNLRAGTVVPPVPAHRGTDPGAEYELYIQHLTKDAIGFSEDGKE